MAVLPVNKHLHDDGNGDIDQNQETDFSRLGTVSTGIFTCYTWR